MNDNRSLIEREASKIVASQEHYLANIPPNFMGSVKTAIIFKHTRDETIKFLGGMIDSVVPRIVPSFSKLVNAVMDFSTVYAENVSVYYTLYNILGPLARDLVGSGDKESGAAIIQIVSNSVSKVSSIKEAANNLSIALKELDSRLIEIVGATNVHKNLEIDTQTAFAEVNVLHAKIEGLRRSLAVEKALKLQLEDTKQSYDLIMQNMHQRMEKEAQESSKLTNDLHSAVEQDGKTQTHQQHHTSRSGFWFWKKYHSYTTSYTTTIDTSEQQRRIKNHLEDSDSRLDRLKNRLEQTSKTRSKQLEECTAQIQSYTEEINILEGSKTAKLATAKAFEGQLQEQRLIAAGCSQENSKRLQEAFKICLPLFNELATNATRISSDFETLSNTVAHLPRVKAALAIGIFDNVTKMAIIGDYVTSNVFSICSSQDFKEGNRIRTIQFNQVAELAKNNPTHFTSNQIADIAELSPNSKASEIALEEQVVPIDLGDVF